jgi:hypothetical protein|tara:strand:- start:590 stop:889 length:300 start_codon:yes stop_codon:yes gene_type:complete
MTEEDYQDTIVALKRKLYATEEIMSDALNASTEHIDGYRHKIQEERGSRRRDAEDISRWMSEILDVLDIEDQDFARQLIRERAEDARARLEKIPSHARA